MNLKPERINELIKRYDFRLNLFWRLTMIKLYLEEGIASTNSEKVEADLY
jgi:hypothetical protein